MKKAEEENHDPNKCFRCRLHKLYVELHQDNEPKFMLAAMAEACGSILSQLNDDDFIGFTALLFKIMCEDKEDFKEKTMH